MCYETAKFEDFVHELFKRIFYITDQLASDISSERSASAAAASKQFTYSRNKGSDENFYQAHLILMISLVTLESDMLVGNISVLKLKNLMRMAQMHNLNWDVK